MTMHFEFSICYKRKLNKHKETKQFSTSKNVFREKIYELVTKQQNNSICYLITKNFSYLYYTGSFSFFQNLTA